MNNKSVISRGKLISMWRSKTDKNNQLFKRIKEETIKKPDTDQTYKSYIKRINLYLNII